MGTIENCYNGITIISKGDTGGIVARNNKKIINCVNTGEIDSSGSYNTGGIAGASEGEIANCYNTGKVSGRQQVGGIVGASYGTKGNHSALVENCYNKGIVTGSSLVGSIAGTNGRNSTYVGGTIQNCYYLQGTYKNAVGTQYSYIKTETFSKNDSEMKNITSMLKDAYIDDGKNIDKNGNIVDNKDENENIIYINNGYPVLKWQIIE